MASGTTPATGSNVMLPRQVVEPEVEPRARLERNAQLRVGLAGRERSIELDQSEVGDEEARRTRELARHQLGDERLVALPSATQLHHVETKIVRLHEGRHGAALTKRKDIADGPDAAHRRQPSAVRGGIALPSAA